MNKLMYFLSIIIFFLISIINLSADINSGIVAHWSFDNDKDSIIIDETGNSINGISYNITYENSPIGKAIRFDSQRDAIHFPALDENPHTKIANLEYGSISVWFKYQSVGAQILPILYFGESKSGTAHNSLIIEIGHGNNAENRKLYFTVINQRFCYDSGTNLEENKWYHFVAIVSPSGNTGYLNGEEMTKRHYNLGSNDTYTDFFANVPVKKMLSIGYGRFGQDDKFYTFKGSIDDVRIYDRPLDSAEVIELYKMGEVADNTSPTYENIAYGDDERHILDFWQAKSDKATPVVVFIHGGGFRSGSKENARSGSHLKNINRCLENGVSFAAINYRLRETTRLDSIMLDCSRAIQFIRSKSDEWHINKDKIASYGGSAGGGVTIWLAFNDDLADPYNEDPVLRESTRLTVCGHLISQASYDFKKWAEILDVSEDWMDEMNTREDLDLYHIDNREQYNDPEIIKLRAFLDMPVFLDKNDPPIYLQNLTKNEDPITSGEVIHHPRHAIYLKNMLEELGIDYAIDLASVPYSEKPNMLDFFFKYLLDANSIDSDNNSNTTVNIYPNPASDYIEINLGIGRQISEICIYNSLGEMLKNFSNNSITSGYRIDISGLENGLYTITFVSNSKLIIKKFIILK